MPESMAPPDDLERRARATLPPDVHAYYAAGAGDEISRHEATAAWRSWRLLPRVLRDVSTVTTGIDLLGAALTAPVAAAPTALHTLAHPDGEIATAEGVAAAGSLLILSARSGHRLETVAAAAGPWWYQVYVQRDRAGTAEQVQRAAAAGARALVLTADAPYVYPRAGVVGALPVVGEQAGEVTPGHRPAAREQDPAATFAAIGWLTALSGLPVLVKGVLHPADAVACADAGAAGVIVSNHGGRQLDRAVPAAHALRPVVEAVAGRVPVLADGGIRDGLDVLTALALGARAVLIGRPVLWSLATGGAAGVTQCFDTYREGLRRAMSLAGVRSPAEVTADLLRPARCP
ncbi:alpha-hydroxy acid oxidase [Actinoplanes sp. N902-109]|uniref:alpha-hydroxy acid oxidase n=1 Tax=Actinoplanes sp. (strain N902-109) TaxID=649831 RepID=UPI0003294B8A|nr:alpha-hydroxy acid oxidase [Actinoplanes sp. N902-109]AGL18978.1 FMN-dependent alpha-hydroxy acid dehydrogenase [Actinoplanes sp. N902-109]